jgi:hypothetical protein
MKDNIKYIGIVDWFYDQIRNAKYGFVRHPLVGQHYFNENLIDQTEELSSFKEDAVVIFNSKESKHKKGSFEAYNVRLIENEIDLEFLFNELLSAIKGPENSDSKKIKFYLENRILIIYREFNEEKKIESLSRLKTIIFDDFNQKNDQFDSKIIIETILFLKKIDNSFSEELELFFYKSIDKKTLLDLWLENKVNYIDEEYLIPSFESFENHIQEKVFNKLNSEIRQKLLLHLIYKGTSDNDQISKLLKFILVTEDPIYTDLFDSIHNQNQNFFLRDFWVVEKDLRAEIIKKSKDSKIALKILLDSNTHFIQNELQSEFFANLDDIRDYFYFLEGYLPDNLIAYKNLCTSKVSIEIAHKLWLIDILDICQIDHIALILNNLDNSEKEKIFSKCNQEDRINIIFKGILNLDFKEAKSNYSDIKTILQISTDYAPETCKKVLAELQSIVPEYYKLNLWIDSYIEELDYPLFKPYVITLSSFEQRRFVKKVLKYIHEGRVSLELDEFTNLNVIDYEISKSIQKVDGTKLDFSTSIILKIVKEVNEYKSFDEKNITSKIFEIVVNQINNPEDILEIEGFFDTCGGRCKVNKKEIIDKDGEKTIELKYERSSFDYPKMHSYCDGRKSLKKGSSVPNLHEITNKEFWWCGNKPCHEPSRSLHSSEDWENYSLMDFLHILKIEYSEIDLELYLNVINKLNRFFSHMNCRSCKHILRPKGKSNYAFSGVNYFCCTNTDCEESKNDKSIYISHCLNGRCSDIIDSRDSVKCSPAGFKSEECGWYICQNCHSCCSNIALKRRIDNLKTNSRNYTCHHEGHKDQGIIFCNECGDTMINGGDSNKRKEIIEFFRQNSSNREIVSSSGRRKNDGGWWFLFSQGKLSEEQFQQKLYNLSLVGFNIPNIADRSQTIQLVAEPYIKEINLLVCSNSKCGKKIDLTKDLERAFAIKKYHDVVFPKEMVT